MKDTNKIYDTPDEAAYAELISLLNNGKEKGLIGVYDMFYKRLLYFGLKYVKHYEVAEEIIGDVFVKLWERQTSFSSISRVQAFLYISVRNRSLNYLRDTIDHEHIDDIQNHEALLCNDKDAFAKIVHTELLKLVYDEVQKLPEKQREVFNKTFLEDKSIEEISKELNMTPQAVYTNKSRALTTLRQNLPLKDNLLFMALLPLFWK